MVDKDEFKLRVNLKKAVYIILVLIGVACNSEDAGDCFQTAGGIIREEVSVSSFTKILVNRDIELIIKEGSTQEIVVETGKNLFNDIEVSVEDNQLVLTNHNTCNFVREYGLTKVFITAPSINEIRSATQYDVRSDGVLTYPNLTILSEDFNAPDTVNTGDFFLNVNNTRVSLVFNNLSNAKITGRTEDLRITLAAGLSRFDGAELEADNVFFSHRSSNDIIVNPLLKLTGKISGTGHVIALNRPAQVDVEAVYKGRLIFK